MDTEKTNLEALMDLARWLGASDASIISTDTISVEDDLAKLCSDLPCESYSLSANCPPYVAGVAGFRELLKGYRQALVFRIEVPVELLFSAERTDLFGLLHRIAADVEQAAHQRGYGKSKGYAGGSCKQIFCRDQAACRVVSEAGPCRHPGEARPSMSGFGINVTQLMKSAGWPMHRAGRETSTGASPGMGTLCGLVLIG